MNPLPIILFFIIAIILYVFYVNVISDPTSADLVTMHNAKNEKVIPSTSLPGSKSSNDYTWSFWIYVNNWNWQYGKEKVLLVRKSSDDVFCPKLSLAENTNNLKVEVGTFNPEGSAADTKTSKCNVKNIPLQKWTHILMTTNTRSIDVYLDGKLVRTCLLSSPPKIAADAPIKLCPENGFSGYMSKVRYYARTLNPREVYSIYKEGYGSAFGSSLFNTLQFKMSVSKDNEEIGAIKF